jgi:hypothetical protein
MLSATRIISAKFYFQISKIPEDYYHRVFGEFAKNNIPGKEILFIRDHL